uniref:Uncharacterized protein n=1 Tax=viral metagenome TaxID=1070528 RepID=A0A6M3Y1W8_9ZZZZ
MIDKKECMDLLAKAPGDGSVLMICADDAECNALMRGDGTHLAIALAVLFEENPRLLLLTLQIAQARATQALTELRRK